MQIPDGKRRKQIIISWKACSSSPKAAYSLSRVKHGLVRTALGLTTAERRWCLLPMIASLQDIQEASIIFWKQFSLFLHLHLTCPLALLNGLLHSSFFFPLLSCTLSPILLSTLPVPFPPLPYDLFFPLYSPFPPLLSSPTHVRPSPPLLPPVLTN